MNFLVLTPTRRFNLKCLYTNHLLCRQLLFRHELSTARQQSTTTTSLSLMIKKKANKAGKKQYADVIQVSDAVNKSVKTKRTVIKKSSTAVLISRMGISERDLKKWNTLKTVKSTTSRQNITNVRKQNVTKVEAETSSCDEHMFLKSKNSVMETQPVLNAEFEYGDEIEETISDIDLQEDSTSKSKVIGKSIMDKTCKDEVKVMKKFAGEYLNNQIIAAYVDVCINCDMINHAHHALMTWRSRIKGSKNEASTIAPNVFNLMISAQARKVNWPQVKEILFAMREDGVKPTLQTYVAVFYCISKLPNQDKKVISNILEDIQKDGLDVRHLDKDCVFLNDERDCVIKVIREVRPWFSPDEILPREPYKCSLLDGFNEATEKWQSSRSERSFTEEDLLKNVERQMQIELDGYTTVKSIQIFPEETDAKTKKMRQLLQRCKENWQISLTERFRSNVNALGIQMTKGKNMRSVNIYPFLSVLNAEEYVKIMIQEICNLGDASETFSLSFSSLQRILGLQVMLRYWVIMKEKNQIVTKITEVYRDYCKYQISAELTGTESPREHWIRLLQKHSKGPTLDVEDVIWPGHVLTEVGKFMYDIIMQETTINVGLLRTSDNSNVTHSGKIPAFYNIYRNSGVQLREEIKPHPFLIRMFGMAGKDTLTFKSNIVPMLVPPLPWTSIKSGGFLLSSVEMIRLPATATLQRIRLANTPHQQISPILDSLNQLGECAWKINKPVLEVIINVFNNNGDESLGIPPPPIQLSSFPTLHTDMSKEEKAKVYKERMWLKQTRAEMYSLWCDALYRLSIANKFKDEVFWFPHNMDFRGRVYPCPPHFNHLGGDVARSLLKFQEGEPLGEKGLDWLKIHLINLTGLKKREPLDERLRFADEMMPEIIDSAERPLNGNRWWAKSDEPWQTLACCMEIVKASASPDPSKYVCHFPIHQDGSCNGLQHYSALGRDILGAEQVNLQPSVKPQDVYSGVAELVEIERQKDAAAGKEIARLLEGFVQRKVIKQTVMTTVYGVTYYGARQQISKQLKVLSDIPMEKQWSASIYLVQKTFQSLQKMFTATKEIQDWLTESARLISQVCGQPMEWVTPLGLPVVQPYHRYSNKTLILGHNKHSVAPSLDINTKPNVMKQKNAFPPNYIHSLDSTHMMLTSLYCRRKGILFVSVHDCFWTHPSTVDIMNKICREQFVALHSLPLLDQLSHYFIDHYSYKDSELSHDGSVADTTKKRLNRLLERVPKTGKFQLENVLDSIYFFS